MPNDNASQLTSAPEGVDPSQMSAVIDVADSGGRDSGGVIDNVELERQTVNPFLCRTKHISGCEWLKMVLLSPLALVRILVILLVVVPLTILITGMATCCLSTERDPRTGDIPAMACFRRFLLGALQPVLRLLMFCLGYLWVEEAGCCPGVCNSECSPAPVIVGNHVSFVDPIWLVYKYLPCAAGKAELADIPVFGSIMRSITPILVERDSPEGRNRAKLQMKFRPQSASPVTEEDWALLAKLEAKVKTLPGAPGQPEPESERQKTYYKCKCQEVATHRAAIEERQSGATPYPPLLVFPEGTTTGDNSLLQFKAGAFTSGMPVQPVVMQYPYCNLDVVWSCDMSTLELFLRMITQVYNRMHVTYLPVYYPSPDEKANPQLYADNVRDIMYNAMAEYDPTVIKTSHSYEDVRLLTKAQKLYRGSIDNVENLKVSTDFTFSDASQLLKMDIDQINMLLTKFRAVDKDGSGTIDAVEFAEAMNLDLDDPCTEHLFGILDPQGHRAFDFCTLLQGLALVSGALGDEEKVKLVFSMYDADNDGEVTHTELVAMLRRKPLVPSEEDASTMVKMSPEKADEIAKDLLGGKTGITLEEFTERVKDHPAVLDYALKDLRKFAEMEE